MPTTVANIKVNCKTGERTTEYTEIPDPTPEEIAAEALKAKAELVKRLSDAVQSYLDDLACQNGGWDSMLSARAAAGLESPFQAQAIKLTQIWADSWALCFQILADAEAGNIEIPSEQELVAAMPVYQP